MVIIGALLELANHMLQEIIKIKILALKVKKFCIAIGEKCAPKIVFRPGKLSGVSRNGPQVCLTKYKKNN